MEFREMRIIALNNLADASRKLGDTERALGLFQEAMKLVSLHGASPSVEAALCTNFGILLSFIGKHDEAIRLQQRALELDKETGDPRSLGFSYHNLGLALLNAGHPESGIENLEEARRIRSKIEDYDELVNTLEVLGYAYLRVDRIEKARECAEQGRMLKSKIGNVLSLRGVTGVLAAVAAREGNWERACTLEVEVIEFLEQLRQQHRRLPELDKYDARYNKHYLEAIELFLEAKRYRAALALIDRTRFRSGCDAMETVRVFGSPFERDALAIPTVGSRELILVEWIYPKHDWSFPIRHRSQEIIPKKIVTSTREGPPIKLDLKTEWYRHFENTLRQTQYVIDAYQAEIEATDRIVFVPHGIQWQTPFAALKHPSTHNSLYRTHELLLSPSLRYCMITDKRTRVKTRNYLVIGDPTGDLPGARGEAKLVAEEFGCKPLLGSAVTRKSFLSALSETEFDVIHYAGHGSYTDDGLHALVLADGTVTDDDILSCKVSANVVNLVACWSGMTDFSVWNELSGFVRALLVSGVRNVVGSTYPVGDEAGRIFSVAFYKQYVNERSRPSKAFQKAIASIPGSIPVRSWGGLYVTGQKEHQ